MHKVNTNPSQIEEVLTNSCNDLMHIATNTCLAYTLFDLLHILSNKLVYDYYSF